MLIQNEKPKSSRRIALMFELFSWCRFVVNMIAQTPQESRTKQRRWQTMSRRENRSDVFDTHSWKEPWRWLKVEAISIPDRRQSVGCTMSRAEVRRDWNRHNQWPVRERESGKLVKKRETRRNDEGRSELKARKYSFETSRWYPLGEESIDRSTTGQRRRRFERHCVSRLGWARCTSRWWAQLQQKPMLQ